MCSLPGVAVEDLVYIVNNAPLTNAVGVVVDGVLVLFAVDPPTENIRCTTATNSPSVQVSITVVG